MTLLTFGSAIIASLGLLSTLLLSRKCRFGWLVSIVTSCLALPYDLTTHQYGFVATGLVALAIAIRAWRSWRKNADCATPTLS